MKINIHLTLESFLNESKDNIQIRKLKPSDLPIIKENLSKVYDKLTLSNDEIFDMIEYDNNSVVCTVDDDVAGFYFLKAINIKKFKEVDYTQFKNKKGIEGIALGVFPKYKSKGIGKKLIEYAESLDFDYIWGEAYEQLGNLQHWLKRRKFYHKYDDEGEINITYKFLK
jgi:GNAT superfamily N-acetyltransferase